MLMSRSDIRNFQTKHRRTTDREEKPQVTSANITVGVSPAPFRFNRGAQQSFPEIDGLDIPIADQVEWLLKHLGEQLTGAVVQVAEGSTLRKWAEEILLVPLEYHDRIGLLFSVALRVESRFDDETVQRFLASDNPYLDDEAPLEVLATAPSEVARARLMGPLRALLGR